MKQLISLIEKNSYKILAMKSTEKKHNSLYNNIFSMNMLLCHSRYKLYTNALHVIILHPLHVLFLNEQKNKEKSKLGIYVITLNHLFS